MQTGPTSSPASERDRRLGCAMLGTRLPVRLPRMTGPPLVSMTPLTAPHAVNVPSACSDRPVTLGLRGRFASPLPAEPCSWRGRRRRRSVGVLWSARIDGDVRPWVHAHLRSEHPMRCPPSFDESQGGGLRPRPPPVLGTVLLSGRRMGGEPPCAAADRCPHHSRSGGASLRCAEGRGPHPPPTSGSPKGDQPPRHSGDGP